MSLFAESLPDDDDDCALISDNRWFVLLVSSHVILLHCLQLIRNTCIKFVTRRSRGSASLCSVHLHTCDRWAHTNFTFMLHPPPPRTTETPSRGRRSRSLTLLACCMAASTPFSEAKKVSHLCIDCKSWMTDEWEMYGRFCGRRHHQRRGLN